MLDPDYSEWSGVRGDDDVDRDGDGDGWTFRATLGALGWTATILACLWGSAVFP